MLLLDFHTTLFCCFYICSLRFASFDVLIISLLSYNPSILFMSTGPDITSITVCTQLSCKESLRAPSTTSCQTMVLIVFCLVEWARRSRSLHSTRTHARQPARARTLTRPPLSVAMATVGGNAAFYIHPPLLGCNSDAVLF